eukprot:gnl/TRDRNA2_/TRDRNA2_67977_c0_seq1.p1 gnl/TRDRNA2_/TRDRNA2_67977_c0~~gnl/TRDRNA2_/TRDRNA2_67977_c0_seq1.p1  ORF type:complete len:176 (+),score=20.78 gnl/TRDRNA2_/TRDRNA2_67977_c0_seq1:316-843(+)
MTRSCVYVDLPRVVAARRALFDTQALTLQEPEDGRCLRHLDGDGASAVQCDLAADVGLAVKVLGGTSAPARIWIAEGLFEYLAIDYLDLFLHEARGWAILPLLVPQFPELVGKVSGRPVTLGWAKLPTKREVLDLFARQGWVVESIWDQHDLERLSPGRRPLGDFLRIVLARKQC